jgi:hypothetical protein
MKREFFPKNMGSAKRPIDFGHGKAAYRRKGQWLYKNAETSKFVNVTDQELACELEKRGYQILYPAHECVDRPNLPCPACGMDAKRALAS